MPYLIEYYMSLEVLYLYKDLHKIEYYLIPYTNNAKLHLILIQKPTLRHRYDFGVPEVRRYLRFHLFYPEDLQPTLPKTELLLRQLPVIQCSGKE